jgi:molybdopterin-guanine dinucleotide biosynthesis protein A
LLGAVLAGGESRRFGSDKAAALLGGKTLVERAAETLGRVFAEVVIVSSRPQTIGAWPHVPDLRQGLGPLAGIEAALLRAKDVGYDGAFTLACDMPLVDESAVRSVVAALGDGWAAAPTSGEGGGIEPLCAAYRVECLPAISRALDEGRLAAHELLTSVGGLTIALPEQLFLNVNTPEDHARVSAVLGTKPR